MARFVSRHRNFRLTIRNEVTEPTATGVRTLVRPLECHFEELGMSEYEVQEGLNRLQFTGLPEDRDTGLPVSARNRLSLFDTKQAQEKEAWTDDEHEIVVNGLRASIEHNQGFIEVTPPPLPPPWPTYDQLEDVDQILRLTLLTGTSPDLVIAYERANRDRQDVIHGLEHIDDPETWEVPIGPDDEEVVVQA